MKMLKTIVIQIKKEVTDTPQFESFKDNRIMANSISIDYIRKLTNREDEFNVD